MTPRECLSSWYKWSVFRVSSVEFVYSATSQTRQWAALDPPNTANRILERRIFIKKWLPLTQSRTRSILRRMASNGRSNLWGKRRIWVSSRGYHCHTLSVSRDSFESSYQGSICVAKRETWSLPPCAMSCLVDWQRAKTGRPWSPCTSWNCPVGNRRAPYPWRTRSGRRDRRLLNLTGFPSPLCYALCTSVSRVHVAFSE